MEPPARNRIEIGDWRVPLARHRRNGMNDAGPAFDGGMHKNDMAAT